MDNIEVAQFLHLMLKNDRLRDVIDTIASKVVLILGRFTADRKAILDLIRQELRRLGFVPVLFDFEKPKSRNLTETVSTLAHIARFVIADISEPKSIPQELQRIIPALPHVPIQPILFTDSGREYGMFADFRDYPWVLETFMYHSADHLLNSIVGSVIVPANKMREMRIGGSTGSEQS